jgi:phosphatidylserine decarboxylase
MIARGGRTAVAVVLVCAVLALFVHVYLAVALTGFTLFLAAIFRDPRRIVGHGIVSPADGTIRDVDVERGYLSIYLALRNVHVTRAPMSGTVSRTAHIEGRHSPAFTRRSVENERLEITILTECGPASLVQMVGSVARRIVPYIEEGRVLSKGERISLIRFGSRVDMWLPPSKFEMKVKKGDKVRAGETKIAEVRLGGVE